MATLASPTARVLAETSLTWRLCPAHGMIELPAGVTTCPRCGFTAIDPGDDAQRDLVEYLFSVQPDARRQRRNRWLTSVPVIAVAITLAFIVVKHVVGIGALAVSAAHVAGEPWRLVTSALTHAGVGHFVGNALGLLAFGYLVDLRVGRARTAAILAVSALAGALAQLQVSTAPMVGISAAVFGLLGASLALMPTLPRVIALYGLAIRVPNWAWSILMIPAFTLVDSLGLGGVKVAWVAHLGGFAAGVLVALPMRRTAAGVEFLAAEKRARNTIERNTL